MINKELLLEHLLDARELLNDFRFQPIPNDEKTEALKSIDDQLELSIKLLSENEELE